MNGDAGPTAAAPSAASPSPMPADLSNDGTLAALAAVLTGLDAATRAKLAAMLLSAPGKAADQTLPRS